MKSLAVIEHFNVIKYRSFGFFPHSKLMMIRLSATDRPNINFARRQTIWGHRH